MRDKHKSLIVTLYCSWKYWANDMGRSVAAWWNVELGFMSQANFVRRCMRLLYLPAIMLLYWANEKMQLTAWEWSVQWMCDQRSLSSRSRCLRHASSQLSAEERNFQYRTRNKKKIPDPAHSAYAALEAILDAQQEAILVQTNSRLISRPNFHSVSLDSSWSLMVKEVSLRLYEADGSEGPVNRRWFTEK